MEQNGDTIIVKSECNNNGSNEVLFFVVKAGKEEYKIANTSGLIKAGNAAMMTKAMNIGAYKSENDLELAKKYDDINAAYDELANSIITKLSANGVGRSYICATDNAFLSGNIRINNLTGVTIKEATLKVKASTEVCYISNSGRMSGTTKKTITNIPIGTSTQSVTISLGSSRNVLAFDDRGGRYDLVTIEMSDEDKATCMKNYSFTGKEYDEYMAKKYSNTSDSKPL